jgi:hypothetical protein
LAFRGGIVKSVAVGLLLAVGVGGCGTVEEGTADAAGADAANADASTAADASANVDADPGDVDATSPADAMAPPDAMLTWSSFTEVAVPFSNHVMLPALSADGRTLYFNHFSQPSGGFDLDVYFATRDSASAAFGAPAPLPGLSSSAVQERYPDVSADGLEIFFTDGNGALRHATRSSPTGTFGALRSVGVNGNFPSISGDRRSLYYVATTGSGADGKVMRVTRSAPGQAWSVPSDIPVPVYVQLYGGIDISQDELSIVIAPAYEDSNRPGDVVVGRRATVADNFRNFTTVGVVQDGFFFNAARWGADDTEIWVGQKVGALDKPFVSRLR